MSKYIFTGFTPSFTFGKALSHLFATGTKKHSTSLKLALKNHYKADDTYLYGNGRSALAAAIKATTPPGSHVAINGLTCYAVIQAIHAADCIPVYLDISEKDLNFTAPTLLAALAKQPNVKTIIIQNHLGLTTDIAAIESITKKRKITIIEDLAHCAGAHYLDGREVGTVGDATALSFGKGKSLHTVHGGALALRSQPLSPLSEPSKVARLSDRLRDRFYPILAWKIRALYRIHLGKIFTALFFKTRLITRSAEGRPALNTRLTHWQAKLAIRELQNLATTAKTRTETAALITKTLSLPALPKGSAPLRVPITFKDRKKALPTLKKSHLLIEDIWYDVPVSPSRYYSKVNFPELDCPITVAVAATLGNIPTSYSPEQLTEALKTLKGHIK